jgi:hypothetical protein
VRFRRRGAPFGAGFRKIKGTSVDPILRPGARAARLYTAAAFAARTQASSSNLVPARAQQLHRGPAWSPLHGRLFNTPPRSSWYERAKRAVAGRELLLMTQPSGRRTLRAFLERCLYIQEVGIDCPPGGAAQFGAAKSTGEVCRVLWADVNAVMA